MLSVVALVGPFVALAPIQAGLGGALLHIHLTMLTLIAWQHGGEEIAGQGVSWTSWWVTLVEYQAMAEIANTQPSFLLESNARSSPTWPASTVVASHSL